MFYQVGSFRNYSFIFDSDDETCELMSNERIKESGVDIQYLNMSFFSGSKFRMMFPNIYRNVSGIIFRSQGLN